MTEWLPLKRFVDPSRPITYGIVQAGADVPGGVPYIRPIDMDEHHGVPDPSELRTTSPEIAARYRRSTIRQGDLVVTIGPSFGKTMVVDDPTLDGANLTQGTARVSPRPAVDARFLQWTLQSKSAVAHWEASVGGATFRALNLGPLAETPIPYVGLPAQRAITDFLDAETARIDSLIATKRRLVVLLEERASRRLNDLFSTEHLVSRDGVPVGLQGHDCIRLGFLARVQTGLTLDAGRVVDVTGPALPYLRVANVQDGSLDLDELKTVAVPRALAARCMLRPGDVLMTEGGDPDKLGRGTVWRGEIEPCLHQNHVFAVRPNRDRLLPEYLALVTRTSYGRRYFEVTSSKTTGIASTSTAKISAFRIPLRPVEAQKYLVDVYLRSQMIQDSVMRSLARQIALLQERRQALITAAVTGGLDIPGAA